MADRVFLTSARIKHCFTGGAGGELESIIEEERLDGAHQQGRRGK